jgi:DNA modification methylase
MLSQEPTVTRAYEEWTRKRSIKSVGTNSGAPILPFQAWHHFKEAFPPELVRRAVEDRAEPSQGCFDPFGGSGTTALASQFLGVPSTTVEVNPFLADVIRAKVARYQADQILSDYTRVRQRARENRATAADVFAHVPATFIEPGMDGRWLFDREVADAVARLMVGIAELENDEHARLFRVLLGGLLVEVSNVVVSGKGRRYRRNWQERRCSPDRVAKFFASRVESALADVYRFADRPDVPTLVVHGDAREVVPDNTHDVAVMSPPYPNSFDYTDVYNVELWMLGYLSGSEQNRVLRNSTLTSHVQLQRDYAEPPAGSPLLEQTLERLDAIRGELWSRWIPDMVGGYFADMTSVLSLVRRGLRDSGKAWLVVGDSKYGGVEIPTASILAELLSNRDWELLSTDPFRAMRSSPQHGGQADLAETLLVLQS